MATNHEKLRVIHRVIASLVIISSDNKVLMGHKDPGSGGVYPNAWHIPGGGVELGESLDAAAIREAAEEVGLDLFGHTLKPLPPGSGATVKTLPTGERVWCQMSFNYFEIRLPQSADAISKLTHPGDDIVRLRWFYFDELAQVELVPGGRELFEQAGYLKPAGN